MTPKQIVLSLQSLRADMVEIAQSKPESGHKTHDVAKLLFLPCKKAIAKDVTEYIDEMLHDLIDTNEDL